MAGSGENQAKSSQLTAEVNDMSGQIYEVEVSEDGRLDFQTQVPDELRGKKVKLILLADDEWESSTDELQEAVDQDWADWLDVREDMYEEYRGQIPKG